MRIFLAGATGVIGRSLLPMLVEAGHEVTAMTRSESHCHRLELSGATPVIGDVFDPRLLCDIIKAASPEIVIHQLTAIPPRMNPRRIDKELAMTNRLRDQGTKNLADAAIAAGARRLISQSIAFVLRPDGHELGREEEPLYLDAPPLFSPMISAVQSLEQTTCNTEALEGIALRFGYFYGPGTIYGEEGSFTQDVRKRKIPISGTGTGVFSFLHVDDAAAATVAAVTAEATGIFNIVDDEPVAYATWLPLFAKAVGGPAPRKVPQWLMRAAGGPYAIYMLNQQRGISNAKAKEQLGWTPRAAGWLS